LPVGMLLSGTAWPKRARSRARGGGSARVSHITELNVQAQVNFDVTGKTPNFIRGAEYIRFELRWGFA
jgi:hypothetical protein